MPPSQQLDISSMTVDDDYQGPRLEGGFRRAPVGRLSTLHGALCQHSRSIAVFQSKAGRPPGPAACTGAAPLTTRLCAAGSPTEGYRITQQFVDSMLEAFRDQKKISVRFAFEIVMGALAALKSEATLVDVEVPTGMPSVQCWQLHSPTIKYPAVIHRPSCHRGQAFLPAGLHRRDAHSMWRHPRAVLRPAQHL